MHGEWGRYFGPSIQGDSKPLMLAAEGGHLAILDALLDAGADKEAVDKVRDKIQWNVCMIETNCLGQAPQAVFTPSLKP